VRWRALAALGLATALALAGFGCGRNKPSSLLVPTGIRPAPDVATGGLFGFVEYDTVNYAGLDAPPYPPATVQAYLGGALVATTTTGGDSRRFELTGLPRGDYSLVVRSHAFSPAGFGLFRVLDAVRDAGDLGLTANTSDSLASTVYLTGDMPGYTVDEIPTFATYCDGLVVGIWTYPNLLFTPEPIAAGTHRIKFVTDASSTAGNLIGWGADASVTLQVPVSNVPAHFGFGAATDIVANFPATGIYDFVFDERRLTFSITPSATASRPAVARRGAPVPARRLP
jgi:hypothetical protein